jgi:hypothetical protein
MTIMTNALIGAEQIQRAGFLQLFTDLNPVLAEIEEFMVTSDQAFAAATARPYVATELEPVAADNFHEGHTPSLISAPITDFPNCCVWVTRAAPAPGSEQYDHQTGWLQNLTVECMAKSETSEAEVDRRIKRMAEAVNVALTSDLTLGGVIHELETPPTVIWGDVFTRKERTAYGPHWFWQGVRMEYPVRKEATMPTASGEFAGLDIDQA